MEPRRQFSRMTGSRSHFVGSAFKGLGTTSLSSCCADAPLDLSPQSLVWLASKLCLKSLVHCHIPEAFRLADLARGLFLCDRFARPRWHGIVDYFQTILALSLRQQSQDRSIACVTISSDRQHQHRPQQAKRSLKSPSALCTYIILKHISPQGRHDNKADSVQAPPLLGVCCRFLHGLGTVHRCTHVPPAISATWL